MFGVILGVLFINNAKQGEEQEISTYINNFIEKTKNNASVDYTRLFLNSAKNNLLLAFILWFAGLTVIGVFVVYGMIIFRGFTFGYTVSSIIATLGIKKGTAFILSTLCLQNIVFIPVLFAFGISGIRLYKSIMKDRRKENIKLEILRHTLISLLLTVVLILASFIETYLSTNIFLWTVNFL